MKETTSNDLPNTDGTVVERTASSPDTRKDCWWCRHRRPEHPVPTGCRRVYVPVYGWLDADDQHRARIDRIFNVPMLVLALLVLPLLGLEYLRWQQNYTYVGRWLLEHPAAEVAMASAWVTIYVAFLAEFFVKVTIAQSRLQYVIRNWLDVLILLLPLLRPLRGLRAIRAIRVARVSRVFTLRGVVMRLIRAVLAVILGMEIVKRIKRRFAAAADKEAPPEYSQWSKAAMISEINRLKEENKDLQQQVKSLESRIRQPE